MGCRTLYDRLDGAYNHILFPKAIVELDRWKIKFASHARQNPLSSSTSWKLCVDEFLLLCDQSELKVAQPL